MFEIKKGKVHTAKKIVLYGTEGIGKTTFAAQFPDPVFIDTEGSTKQFDVARFPDPLSWQMLLDEVQSVISNPSVCRTLVIDTLDWAEKLAYNHVCDIKKWDSIESPGYGAGYRYAYEEMGNLLNLLSSVVDRGVNVLLNAHATMRKFEQPDEMGAYDRWELKLQTSSKCNTASMVKEWADAVFFANYDIFTVKNNDKNAKAKAQGGRRVMYTTHHPCWDAKNRFDLPEKLPFDYAQVAHCFLDEAAERPEPPAAIHQEEPAISPAPEPPAGIPPALEQLMRQYQVTEEDIRRVVAHRGYYPESTPISNYDPQFVSGVLVGAWQQVYQMIKGA